MLRGITRGKQIIKFSNRSNRGRVRSLNTRRRFRLAVKTSNAAAAFKKVAMITHNLPSSSLR